MTTAVTISPTPILSFLDNQGRPAIGGSVLTQIGGVNAATYQDSAGTIPLPNPIPLNNRGEISNSVGASCQLFITKGAAYTFTLFDAAGNQLNQASYVATPNDLVLFIAQLATAAGAALVGFMAAGSSFLRTVQDKLREWTSGTDFGADPTGVAPSGAMINQALGSSNYVDLGTGNYNIETTILIPAGKVLKLRGATLKPSADIVTVRLLGQASRLSGNGSILVTGTNTSNAIDVGDVSNNAHQAIVERINIDGAGLASICGRHGNLALIYKVSSTNSKQDDLSFTQETPDCNGWNIISFDGNTAVRDGHHIPGSVGLSNPNNSRSHTFIGGSIQSAGRYSIYSGTPKNVWKGVYTEGAGTADVFFDTFASANEVELTEGATYFNTPGVAAGNRITHSNPDASGRRIDVLKVFFGGGTGNGIGVANNDETAGELYVEKRGARSYVVAVATSGADQLTSFVNDAGGSFQHQVSFGGNIYPTLTNSFTCGVSSLAWSGGFTEVAFVVTSDRETKTEERQHDDREMAVAMAMAKLPKLYKLKTSISQKGSDKARWHSGMVAQDVQDCFSENGLDSARYGLWCSDDVMTGIGEVLLDKQGRPITEGGGRPIYKKGTPVLLPDGSPKLTPGFPMVDQIGKPLVIDGVTQKKLALRYEEAHSFILAGVARKLEQQDASISDLLRRIEDLEAPNPEEAVQ